MNELLGFIKEGRLKSLYLGNKFDRLDGEWISSIEQYENGVPKFYKGIYQQYVVDIGVDAEQKISYVVIHMEKQHQSVYIDLQENKIDLKSISLDKFIQLLNQLSVDWYFKYVFEKIVILSSVKNNVEFVFSFYPDQLDGALSIIQVSSLRHKNEAKP